MVPRARGHWPLTLPCNPCHVDTCNQHEALGAKRVRPRCRRRSELRDRPPLAGAELNVPRVSQSAALLLSFRKRERVSVALAGHPHPCSVAGLSGDRCDDGAQLQRPAPRAGPGRTCALKLIPPGRSDASRVHRKSRQRGRGVHFR